MSDQQCEIMGLVGFIVAGIIFILVGMRDGDALVAIGSVVWTLACVLWLIPHMRGKDRG
ncbi:MAG: hypothetical protein HKN18_15275 [Silicimonas sp.]|nr:hypothetical protein [Silicimonas sp.]